jgi:hypothetical protein
MNPRSAALLTAHGALILLLACAIGFPFAEVLKADLQLPGWFPAPGNFRAWHMAHLEALLNGMLVLAGAAVATRLALSRALEATIFWGLLADGWGNSLGALVAALDGGKRIVALGAGDQNLLAFALFSIAAAGGIVALVALVVGGLRTAAGRVASRGVQP